MGEIKKDAVLKSIGQLKQELGIPDAVFEGVKAANGWKNGKEVKEQVFLEACEAFRRAPVDGSRENREAKG